jgi:hypothetical protein
MSFADEPSGLHTQKSGLARMVGPQALQRADLVIGVIHDVVADVI